MPFPKTHTLKSLKEVYTPKRIWRLDAQIITVVVWIRRCLCNVSLMDICWSTKEGRCNQWYSDISL